MPLLWSLRICFRYCRRRDPEQVEAALREAEAQRQVDRLEYDLSVARSIHSRATKRHTGIGGFEIAGWNSLRSRPVGTIRLAGSSNGTMVAELADVTAMIGPALLAAVCRAYARAIFSRGKRCMTHRAT